MSCSDVGWKVNFGEERETVLLPDSPSFSYPAVWLLGKKNDRIDDNRKPTPL